MKYGEYECCTLCHRACGKNRYESLGFCKMGAEVKIARAALHMWEEPPISATHGSGTVFFAGCSLGCIYCQNATISRAAYGKTVTIDRLSEIMLDLEGQGAHNINFVTPTHYTAPLAKLLETLKPRLRVPVVWNSGGYESVESLRMLEGLVDIYLPDFKYHSPELARDYSAAPDYPARATEAVLEMYRQTGKYREEEGLCKSGVIIRHLVLPGCRADSIAVLRHIASILPVADIRVSVMRQYTPDFAMDSPYKNLRRRVTAFEYDSVMAEAAALGILGFSQGKEAATKAYTPPFDEE